MDRKQISNAIKKYRYEADFRFNELAEYGKEARTRGHFTKEEFLEVCGWKSSMRMDLCRGNTEKTIEARTKAALAESDLRRQITYLVRLKGVAVPRASAILAVSDPTSFGVIDVRAWQCLHRAGLVYLNRAGKGLSINNWVQYVKVLRDLATKHQTTPRIVEYSLYLFHENRYTTSGKEKEKNCQRKWCQSKNHK